MNNGGIRGVLRFLPGFSRLAEMFDSLGRQVAELGSRTTRMEDHMGDISHRLPNLEERFYRVEVQFHRTMHLLEHRMDQVYHNLINAMMARPGGSVTFPEGLSLEDPAALGAIMCREADGVYAAGSFPLRSERYAFADPVTETDRQYMATHLRRFEVSLDLLAALKTRLGEVPVIADLATSHLYHPALGALFPEARLIFVGSGRCGTADMQSSERREWLPELNLETAAIPLPDASVDLVLCQELLEHFSLDPLFALAEVNRILKDGGTLFLSTPNLASWAAATSVLTGYSPLTYARYSRSRKPGEIHVREWVPRDVEGLLKAAGFAPVVTTQNVYHTGTPETIRRLLQCTGVPISQTGDTIFAVATKVGPVAERYPAEYYDE